MDSARLLGRYDIRTPRLTDATALAAAYTRNRAHLAPYEPLRRDDFFTADVQRESLRTALDLQAQKRSAGWLILDRDRVIGRMNLNNVVYGVLRSADLGYWVDSDVTGRGVATAAVEFVCAAASRELGLHRVAASTLVDNEASKAVLSKCGFEPIGRAPSFLFIDGAWRDHDLYAITVEEVPALT